MKTDTANNPETMEEEEVAMENEQESAAEGDVIFTSAVDKAKVEKVIHSSVYASMGIGVLLLPIISLASVTAIQLSMVRKTAMLYGVDFKENRAKKIMTAVIGAGVPVLATGPVEWVVLKIPTFGTAFAFATMPALNGLSTYAVGQMFVAHFERGGDLSNVNTDSMKEDFKTAYQNAREWLGDKISGKKAAKTESR